MSRPKPKTVRAWCFAVRMNESASSVWDLDATRSDALHRRRRMESQGFTVGPVVRIEVPAPKERKR